MPIDAQILYLPSNPEDPSSSCFVHRWYWPIVG